MFFFRSTIPERKEKLLIRQQLLVLLTTNVVFPKGLDNRRDVINLMNNTLLLSFTNTFRQIRRWQTYLPKHICKTQERRVVHEI